MEEKTTEGLQSIVALKDESIRELETLHGQAVPVIDNSQVVAAANQSKNEVTAHLNTAYTDCNDKRTELRNNLDAHVIDKEELFYKEIEKQSGRLVTEGNTQDKRLRDKILSTPVNKIARDTNMVGSLDVNTVGLKKYIGGYKFPYKPNLYLNSGLVDLIHGIKPRGYDTIHFREDGVFDNADSILTGQVVEGEYLWLGRDTENLFALKYLSDMWLYNGNIIEFVPIKWAGKAYDKAILSIQASSIGTYMVSVDISDISRPSYGEYISVIVGDNTGNRYIMNIFNNGKYECLTEVTIDNAYNAARIELGTISGGQKYNKMTCTVSNAQFEKSDFRTPWVSYGQSRKPTNIMYDNIQSEQKILYMEIFGKPKIQEDQITLVEGKDYDILVKKEIANLFTDNVDNRLLINRETNKIYLNGELVSSDLYIIINQEMVMKIEYDNYFMERSIIDLYRGVKPLYYNDLIWEGGTYSSTGDGLYMRCGGYIGDNGIYAGLVSYNMFNTVNTSCYGGSADMEYFNHGTFKITKKSPIGTNIAYGIKNLKPSTIYTIQCQLIESNITDIIGTRTYLALHYDSFGNDTIIVHLNNELSTRTISTAQNITGNGFGIYVRIGEDCPVGSYVKIKVKVEERTFATPIQYGHRNVGFNNLFDIGKLDRTKNNALLIEMGYSGVPRYVFAAFDSCEYIGVNFKSNADKNKFLLVFKNDKSTAAMFLNNTKFNLNYVNTGYLCNYMSILHRQDTTASTDFGYSPHAYVKKYVLYQDIDLTTWTDDFCKKLTL